MSGTRSCPPPPEKSGLSGKETKERRPHRWTAGRRKAPGYRLPHERGMQRLHTTPSVFLSSMHMETWPRALPRLGGALSIQVPSQSLFFHRSSFPAFLSWSLSPSFPPPLLPILPPSLPPSFLSSFFPPCHPLGRVGDSPIVGSGLYADSAVGGAVATGDGEEIMRVCLSFLVVEKMREGLGPALACQAGIRRLKALISEGGGRARDRACTKT